MARKKITGQISKRFTLEEVTLIVEAISIFRDSNRRMTTGLFDKDGRMYSDRRREALKTEELMELMASGEVEIRSVPMGSKFTTEEHDILEELWDVFVAGMGKIEDKIEQNINDTVEENISGVIDDLYTMLKGETK
jgi:mannose-6-phosphate isomerase-like protein (cupin superfamily)